MTVPVLTVRKHVKGTAVAHAVIKECKAVPCDAPVVTVRRNRCDVQYCDE